MSRRINRRRLLTAGLLTVPSVAAAAAGGLSWVYATADVDTAGRLRFTNRLAVPPLAPSTVDGSGRRVFELRAAPGRSALRAGPPTRTWGVNGPLLGPTLRANRGETVLVRVRNDLPEATSLHWHGMHLPARMDGGPHQTVPAGGEWSPSWRIDQPAATLWYHPHPHEQTARHTYRGIAGMFVIDDPAGPPAGLPHRYGVDDVPVIIQDKKFTDGNQFDESAHPMSGVGVVGDTVLVNGTVTPYLPVTTERIRLRLLNGSAARAYRLGLADDRPFALVGTDGGLLAGPHQTNRIQLTPGERAEIVVDLRPGERVVLRSHPPELGLIFWDGRFSGAHDTLDILELRAADRLEPSPALPSRLAAPPDLSSVPPAATRRFEMSGFKINGLSMDMNRIDFAATRDTVEVWEVVALDDQLHNFHVHDTQFQVLSVNGAPPGPELSGWKDTVHTPQNVTLRLAMRFRDHTDRNMPYMFHCHVLYHEDQGLMGQFVVVEPGQTAGRPSADHQHG
ncbi:multicopper oxidase family protein [Plantactinospora sp. GCM10030261]|uniref:multicopper oxidase family protein n=1 Tax=Plantactinospora sp. GCM10030261 TaxID=3273420 RepID=UPI00360CFEA8